MYENYEQQYPELLEFHLKRVDTPRFFNNDILLQELLTIGVEYLCYIKGRGLCGLQRMAYTIGLFYGYDHSGYVGRYCYQTKSEAMEALKSWDGNGDPAGNWIKHKGIGEYSNPKNRPND